MTPLRKRLIALALAVATLVLVALSCGGDDEPVATTSTTSTSTSTSTTSTTTTLPPTTTTEAGPVSMLNGTELAVGADLDRRVVAMKVDNHPDARPQSGLQEAEAVVEIIVEGGITRFIALFHGTDSEYVGPIRSGRPTDPTMLAPLGATFQISGGQGWVESIISSAGVPYLTEAEDSTFRIPNVDGRAYERTLYGSTIGVRQVADEKGFPDEPPAEPWFTFGEPRRSNTTADRISMSWDSNWPDVVWEWDGERYLRFNADEPHDWVDVEGNGDQIAADTLVVLKGEQYTACPSGSGSCVPAMHTTGTGEALVFHDGTVTEGTWEREEIDDLFDLRTADGRVMRVPPGYLWVSVFPDHQPLTWE